MTDKVIFDLVRNSSSLFTLVKSNGDIVLNSRVFDNFIADKLPYEGNLLDMIMHTNDIVPEIKTMYRDRKIDISLFPQEIHINNNSLKITHNSNVTLNNEDVIIIEIHHNTGITDSFTEHFVISENLFIKNKKNLLVYDSSIRNIIAINNSTQHFVKHGNFDDNKLSAIFGDLINEIVNNAIIGGVSSKKSILTIANREVIINIECCSIDTNHRFFLVSFKDETITSRENDIISLDKERAHNIIDVVPGILFEFKITNNTLEFTYISESIKNIIGLSAKHILNDSSKLLGYLNKQERARLHYFFTRLTEEERKIRNEFMITDHNDKTRWVTINWHETQSKEGTIKGTGYIDDITEKKKNQIQKRELIKRKEIKNYFSISLLKHESIPSLVSDLAKAIVNKLLLQDVAIYIYNPDSMTLEYATSYSALERGGTRFTYPNEIPINKGIIGRVVNSQKSEVINYSSDDTDYYSIDKPSESEITVPIIFEGELLGIIDSEHIKPNFFTKEHLYLLEDISESLAIRLIQKKRQDDNLKFYTTLSLLYNRGKIFDFNLDLKTNKLNDSCIDNLIYLIGINDTSKKIKIYKNSKILLKYILQYDIEELAKAEQNIKDSAIETKEVTFRIITELGFVKWLKVIASNFNKNEFGKIISIDGTIQDVSKFKELEFKSNKFENLQSSIKISKKQLEKNGDIYKSIDLVGHTFNVSEINISKFDINKKHKFESRIKWNYNSKNNSDMSSIFKIANFEDKLKSKLLFDISDLEEKSKASLKNIKSFICIPVKTNSGLWGVITFIERSKKRKWKDFEKNLLIVYTNLISNYIE